MFEVTICLIAANLWRWELRGGGVLLRCGTAPTDRAAEMAAERAVQALARPSSP
jgi:hypothetical protein